MKQNEAAFPRTQWTGSDRNVTHRDVPGMTIRQWYKGQAVMGLMNVPGAIGINLRTIVKATADIADALLAEDEEHEEAPDAK